MGYVVNQASLYSFKGERLNAARDLQFWLVGADEYYKDNEVTLEQLYQAPIWKQRMDELCLQHPKYFKLSEYDIGGNRMRPCFMILEKTLPFTNKLVHTIEVVATLIKKYGSRADAASESNVDWKATMHAVRIVDEGLQLLGEHKLSFPFEQSYVDRLLSMKRGELPLDPIKEELSQKLEKLKELEKSTTLQAYDQEMQKRFDAWLALWMMRFYKL
jgi:hypothetical protein